MSEAKSKVVDRCSMLPHSSLLIQPVKRCIITSDYTQWNPSDSPDFTSTFLPFFKGLSVKADAKISNLFSLILIKLEINFKSFLGQSLDYF